MWWPTIYKKVQAFIFLLDVIVYGVSTVNIVYIKLRNLKLIASTLRSISKLWCRRSSCDECSYLFQHLYYNIDYNYLLLYIWECIIFIIFFFFLTLFHIHRVNSKTKYKIDSTDCVLSIAVSLLVPILVIIALKISFIKTKTSVDLWNVINVHLYLVLWHYFVGSYETMNEF